MDLFKALAGLLLGLAAVLSGAGSGPRPALSDTSVSLVSSLPALGEASDEVVSMENAIRMAIAETPGRPGVALRYEPLDDSSAGAGGWDTRLEARNARHAVEDPSVMAYLGPFDSGAAVAALPILNRADLLTISPAAAYVGLTRQVADVRRNEPGRYYPSGVRTFIRTIPASDRQGAAGAVWASQLGAQRVYLLHDGQMGSRRLATAFAEQAAQLGLQVVADPTAVDPLAVDLTGVTNDIQARSADLVYLAAASGTSGGRLVKRLRGALGSHVMLMGSDRLYNQTFLDAADDAAEGFYVTFNAVPPAMLSGRGEAWHQAYLARYGAEPGVYAAYAYDAASLAVDALRRASSLDRSAVRAAAFATHDFDGVLGRYSIDQNGETSCVRMSGRQVRDGSFDDESAVLLTLSCGS